MRTDRDRRPSASVRSTEAGWILAEPAKTPLPTPLLATAPEPSAAVADELIKATAEVGRQAGSDVGTQIEAEARGNVETSAAVDSYFGLRGGDQLIVGLLIGASTLLMLVHWVRLSNWGSQPVEIEHHARRHYEYRLDINEATWVEWANLQGLGETLSRRIVAERQKHGSYVSIDDLQRVRGIGPKTVERIRRWLLEPRQRSSRQARPVKSNTD